MGRIVVSCFAMSPDILALHTQFYQHVHRVLQQNAVHLAWDFQDIGLSGGTPKLFTWETLIP